MRLARRAWRALLARRSPPAPVEAREAYERLAACYPPEPHNALMELEDVAMAELLPSVAGRRALDLGCGSGRFLRRLHDGGAARVAGCDAAAAMLDRARAASRAWRPQPLLVRADLLALPFRGASFDVVACGLVLGHVADLRAALAEIARLLAPGGVAVWSDLHPAGTLAGWQRDFVSADGERIVVRQHLHLFEDHVAGCRLAGLVLDDVREPRLLAAPEGTSGAAVERGASAPRAPGPGAAIERGACAPADTSDAAVERGASALRAPGPGVVAPARIAGRASGGALAERAVREHPQRGWPAVLVLRARKPA